MLGMTLARRRSVAILVGSALLAAACGGDGRAAESSLPPSASPSTTPSSSPEPSPSPSPEPEPSPSPEPRVIAPLRLGPGVPKVYRKRVPASQIPAEALAPADAVVTNVVRLPPAGDAAEQIVLTWTRGGEPFRREHGLVIWEASTGRPPWRAVAGFHDPIRQEVLGIRLQAGDLTGDGHMDVLSFEETGGSGACGRWRVFATWRGAVRELFRRETCDAGILLSEGALKVASAVYEPGDAHCCPSFTRRTTLQWNGEKWARVDVELVPNEFP